MSGNGENNTCPAEIIVRVRFIFCGCLIALPVSGRDHAPDIYWTLYRC